MTAFLFQSFPTTIYFVLINPSAIGWVNWLVPILARALGAPNQGAPELWDFCNARQIFFSSHIADRFSCSAVTKLQQTEAGE